MSNIFQIYSKCPLYIPFELNYKQVNFKHLQISFVHAYCVLKSFDTGFMFLSISKMFIFILAVSSECSHTPLFTVFVVHILTAGTKFILSLLIISFKQTVR